MTCVSYELDNWGENSNFALVSKVDPIIMMVLDFKLQVVDGLLEFDVKCECAEKTL